VYFDLKSIRGFFWHWGWHNLRFSND